MSCSPRLFRDGEVVGVVDIVTDATDRVKAFQRLEARIAAFTSLAAGMTVDQPLEVTLREVVAAVLRTTEAVACSVLCWAEEPVGAPVAYVSESFAPGYAEALAASWTTDTGDPVLEPPRLTVTAEVPRRGAHPAPVRPVAPVLGEPTWGDIAAVPVSASGRSFGELHLYLPAGTQLDGDDETYLLALADQAAVAAQNAALFGTAAQNATLLERQRLSRDLHDSVSQALFSMTLHARAAERHLEAAGAGSSAAAGEVARLRELTAGALAEMRALIFELRPGALAEEGLAAALTKQAAAIAARAAVPVDVTTPEVRVPLDPDVEEHLYRLAMEALNNALRHARRLAAVAHPAGRRRGAHGGGARRRHGLRPRAAAPWAPRAAHHARAGGRGGRGAEHRLGARNGDDGQRHGPRPLTPPRMKVPFCAQGRTNRTFMRFPATSSGRVGVGHRSPWDRSRRPTRRRRGAARLLGDTSATERTSCHVDRPVDPQRRPARLGAAAQPR